MLAAVGRMTGRLPARHAMVASRAASERCSCVRPRLAHGVVAAPHMPETREPVSGQRQGKHEQGEDSQPAHHENQIPNLKQCQSTAPAGLRIAPRAPFSLTSPVSQRLGVVDRRLRTGLRRGEQPGRGVTATDASLERGSFEPRSATALERRFDHHAIASGHRAIYPNAGRYAARCANRDKQSVQLWNEQPRPGTWDGLDAAER